MGPSHTGSAHAASPQATIRSRCISLRITLYPYKNHVYLMPVEVYDLSKNRDSYIWYPTVVGKLLRTRVGSMGPVPYEYARVLAAFSAL